MTAARREPRHWGGAVAPPFHRPAWNPQTDDFEHSHGCVTPGCTSIEHGRAASGIDRRVCVKCYVLPNTAPSLFS